MRGVSISHAKSWLLCIHDFIDSLVGLSKGTFLSELLFFVSLVLISISAMVSLFFFFKLLRVFMKKDSAVLFLRALRLPLITLLGIICLITLIRISSDFEQNFENYDIQIFEKLAIIYCISWCFLRYANLFDNLIKMKKNTSINNIYVDLVLKIVKIVVIIIAMIMTLDVFNVKTHGILTVAGASGFALALASRGLLSNLLGTIVVYFDHPFSIGDYIKIGNNTGTVEHIGIRMTTITTDDHMPLYIPNSLFSSDMIRNYSRRTSYRIDQEIPVYYDNIAKFIKDAQKIEKTIQKRGAENIIVSISNFKESMDTIYFMIRIRGDIVAASTSDFEKIKAKILSESCRVLSVRISS